ncbi:DUF2849 domain-containing protein [Pelagibius sp. Alg239-R121]|uniref:DUF2849 domain-containing protein n=1 Tax=Pelagibius sp. Alg239-R121 TaxID=2993448 RepID=UPI0024A669FE|nr:DUF2849 domain-containing protein [Pelagibius sp. Alg239-R121]
MTVQILTANRLGDGAVVYRSQAGEWTARLGESRVLATAEDAARILAEAETPAAALEVVGPYLMPVDNAAGEIRPVEMREFIRAKGPSNRTDLGYQAENNSPSLVG